MRILQHMRRHFKRIASVYGHVRNTDPGIIGTIIPRLPCNKHRLDVADIGCGTGRYSTLIASRSDRDLRIFCCDYSGAMLQQCRKRMRLEFPSTNMQYCLINANDLPFAHGCFDAVTSFNAVHHFDLSRFVEAAARVLRPGGLLSIYTRTPEQNARTVWGQHFPGFAERETRLYQCERIEEAIGRVSELQLEGMQEFKHVRVEAVESLLNRARHFHYSTFTLYAADEFRLALEIFAKRMADISMKGKIKHNARNTMVFVRRI
jgi:ubiquinone/menaquinone biosynthesis C-methylase UbiE